MATPEDIIEKVADEIKGKHGLICLACAVMMSPYNQLKDFFNKQGIQAENPEILTKFDFLNYMSSHFYNQYESKPELHDNYSDTATLMGDNFFKDENLKQLLKYYDYLTKQELIIVIADFLADQEFSVFNSSKISEKSPDIFCSKKFEGKIITNAIYIRTGDQINEEQYQLAKEGMKQASDYSTEVCFVTSATGAYKIGLFKIFEDMKKLNFSLHLVDPLHMRIFQIVKGKIQEDLDTHQIENFFEKLPVSPIRAPSQIRKISKYEYIIAEEPLTDNVSAFEFLNNNEYKMYLDHDHRLPQYRNIFRNLMIIDKYSGITLLSHSGAFGELKDDLAAGFLTAMDTFVSEMGGPSALREIDYKGFIVLSSYGKDIKVALFLSQKGDQVLRERLKLLVTDFEERFADKIELFKSSSNVGVFQDKQITLLINEILSI